MGSIVDGAGFRVQDEGLDLRLAADAQPPPRGAGAAHKRTSSHLEMRTPANAHLMQGPGGGVTSECWDHTRPVELQ